MIVNISELKSSAYKITIQSDENDGPVNHDATSSV